MDSDQTCKQKASLSKAPTSCQCFKLYIGAQLSKKQKKRQTVAARLNIRRDKPPLGAKYSCKTGLFP